MARQHVASWRQPSIVWLAPSVALWWLVFMGPMTFIQKEVLDTYGDSGDTIWTVAVAVRGALSFLLTPLVGAISDKYGRRGPLCFFTLINGALYLPLLLGEGQPTIQATLILIMVSGTGGNPMALHATYCSDLVSPEGFSAKYAQMLFWGYTISYMLSGQLCHYLFAVLHKPFWIFAAIAVLNTAYCWLILPESRWFLQNEERAVILAASEASLAMSFADEEGDGAAAPVPAVKLNPFGYFRILRSSGPAGPTGAMYFRKIALLCLLMYLAKFAIIHIAPLFAMEVLNWTPGKATWLSTVYGFAQLLLCAVTPMFLRLTSDVRVLALVGMLNGLVAALLLSVARSGWELLASEFLMGIAYWAWMGAAGYARYIASSSMRGEVQGVCTAIVSLAEATGPPVYGVLLAWGVKHQDQCWWLPNTCFFMAVACFLLALLVLATLPTAEKAALQVRNAENCKTKTIS